MARDSHSVWLNSAALARANGDLHVPGGVVEVDERGEPTGVLREESCWTFRDRYIEVTDDEYVAAMRRGMKLASSRGVVAVHDKDGWLGALRFWQRLAEHDGLTLRVWQSLPHEKVGELESADVRSGLGDDYLRLGYLKAFMDGTLGSQTARMLDGTGVEITVARRARGDHPPRRPRRLPGRRARDRRPREPRGAGRVRGDAARLAAARAAAPDRARAAAHARRRAALRPDRCRGLRAVQPRDLRPRPRRALLERAHRTRVRVALALGRGRAARERLRRADRGARPVGRRGRGRPAHLRRAAAVASRAGGHGRGGARRDLRRRRRGSRATSGGAGSSCPATSPTSSCSTATRSRSTPEELPDVRVVATMVGGRWVHNPPPWDS